MDKASRQKTLEFFRTSNPDLFNYKQKLQEKLMEIDQEIEKLEKNITDDPIIIGLARKLYVDFREVVVMAINEPNSIAQT